MFTSENVNNFICFLLFMFSLNNKIPVRTYIYIQIYYIYFLQYHPKADEKGTDN